MKEINEKTFAAICFMVLMSHHGKGVLDAHPNYIEEKLSLLDRGFDAYLALDHQNQQAVVNHLEEWGFSLPRKAEEFHTNKSS